MANSEITTYTLNSSELNGLYVNDSPRYEYIQDAMVRSFDETAERLNLTANGRETLSYVFTLYLETPSYMMLNAGTIARIRDEVFGSTGVRDMVLTLAHLFASNLILQGIHSDLAAVSVCNSFHFLKPGQKHAEKGIDKKELSTPERVNSTICGELKDDFGFLTANFWYTALIVLMFVFRRTNYGDFCISSARSSAGEEDKVPYYERRKQLAE